MPGVSRLGLKAPLVVKRVPIDIQDGASLGYMNFASLDGSRPAIYYINLKSTSLWPKYQIPTLTAHEGVPGHTWQGAYLAEHHADLPLISSLMGFNAFIEGWALYAEQLMDEAGLYADDPFGQVGYLQAQQFRACRLVVDTGLHAMKWTRDQAIDFLVNETRRDDERSRPLQRFAGAGLWLQDGPQRDQQAARPRESRAGQQVRSCRVRRYGGQDRRCAADGAWNRGRPVYRWSQGLEDHAQPLTPQPSPLRQAREDFPR